jgi:cardiolipin synthase
MGTATPSLAATQSHATAPETLTRPTHVHVAGHELRVYVEYLPLVKDILEDLRAAQSRIWIEVYIFAGDPAGQALATVLKEKARAGLDVRVLYDAVGSQATPAAFFAELQAAGVHLHCYHSLIEALSRFRLFSIMNRRDHRKLIVIDDAVGYFGGMNLIDHTASAHVVGKPVPATNGWHDVHLRLAGPQQAELAESFERSWARAQGQKITRRSRAYRRARLPGSGPAESIRFFDSGPGLKYSRAARVYDRLLRRAEHNITIAMAYFVPVGRVLRALLAARKRGVRVRIVIPGQSDNRLVQHATTHVYATLLKRGIRLYERQTRMLHSKVMVVDATWTLVGSCNLDPRSLWINLEFLAVIRSPTLAATMTAIVRREMRQSNRVTSESYPHRWHERLLNTLAWIFRWWL